MNILEVYEKYDTPPMLQLHHLRVAAVAKQICENMMVPVDETTVIKACLLHDIANIIKFEFNYEAEFYEPQGPAYWQKVQAEFFDKYGRDEHAASVQIAREIGMDDRVLDCIESVDFGMAVQNAQRPELEPKICDNADMRVDPKGVVSLDQRIEEGAKRYKDRPDKWLEPEVQRQIIAAVHKIQDQIFRHSKIKPSDITNESIAPIIEQLKTYEI